MDRVPPPADRLAAFPTPAEALLTLPRDLGRVLIAVPDFTRCLDLTAALSALSEHLRGEVTVVVGLGLHRPLTDAELAPLRAACPWPVLNHAPDACAPLGEVHGIPCAVNPLALAADTVITVGVVELHQYAGFSGGHKGVAVGLGGRETLSALHRRELVCDERVVVGQLEGNPFRAAIDAMGERIGVRFALQALPDGRWLAGPPVAALHAAARLQRPWTSTPQRYHRVVLRVPAAKAVNFYQASRAATYLALSPSPPLHPGATLVLDAACPEGMGLGSGEQAFAQLMAATDDWSSLLTGPVPAGAGIQRAFMLARLAERYRLQIRGCAHAAELRAHGLDAQEEPPELDEETLLVPRPFLTLPQWAPSSAPGAGETG